MLPPWLPGVPQLTGAPAGATPMTPIIGLSGKETASFQTSESPSTLQKCMLQASNRSPQAPSPFPVQEAVCASSSMFSIETFNAPPALAPFTKTGPVAGLMASQSMESSVSASLRTWLPKQSFVRMRTVSPDSTVRAGASSEENA